MPSSADSTVRLDRPRIGNFYDRAFDVDVQLLDAGETVYWRTVHVGSDGTHLEGVPTTAGAYVLYARLVDVDRATPVRCDVVETAAGSNTDCVNLDMWIDAAGATDETHPVLSVTTTGTCDGGQGE